MHLKTLYKILYKHHYSTISQYSPGVFAHNFKKGLDKYNDSTMADIKKEMDDFNVKLSDALALAKENADGFKKETISASLDNIILILKESERKMAENKLNNVNFGLSVNLGPVTLTLNKYIKSEQE